MIICVYQRHDDPEMDYVDFVDLSQTNKFYTNEIQKAMQSNNKSSFIDCNTMDLMFGNKIGFVNMPCKVDDFVTLCMD